MSDESGVERIDLEKVDWRGSREFFESLGEALDKLDDKDESYDFTWVGKRKSIIEAGAPINKTFRPDVENSKNWDTTENLFIEGDNLDALKLLQESYLGKVKLIYIDPPYNTGRNLIYKNDFTIDKETYEAETGSVSEYGEKLVTNLESESRFHSDWCSMFYSRAKVARNLLSDDGFFVCAMDDSEIANTIKILDEVFGEDNRLGIVAVKNNPSGRSTSQGFSIAHEYALFYAKNNETKIGRLDRSDIQKSRYKESDDRGHFEWVNFRKHGATREQSPKMFYPIFVGSDYFRIPKMTWDEAQSEWTLEESPAEDEAISFPVDDTGKDARWKWSIERLRAEPGEATVRLDRNGKPAVYIKSRMNDEGMLPLTWWDKKEYSATSYGTNFIKSLFNQAGIFDYPKSINLMEDILRLTTQKNSLILDFFSGSGTTAHAAMRLNAEDGGDRKWIMVQLPEVVEEKSAAFRAGYKSIPEISRQRIRLAGEDIAKSNPEIKADYGFRALRIDDTNHKNVYRPAADYQQSMLDDLVDNVKEDRSDLDLLYGVLTATAWELNKPLETVELDGATVYKYDYFGEVSGLVACFADAISEKAIKQIAQLKPLTAVFKEGSFPNSQAKVNLAEHFRIISSDTKVKVI